LVLATLLVTGLAVLGPPRPAAAAGADFGDFIALIDPDGEPCTGEPDQLPANDGCYVQGGDKHRVRHRLPAGRLSRHEPLAQGVFVTAKSVAPTGRRTFSDSKQAEALDGRLAEHQSRPEDVKLHRRCLPVTPSRAGTARLLRLAAPAADQPPAVRVPGVR